MEERLHSCQRDLKGEDATLTTRAFIGGDPVDFLLVADGHGGKTASLLARANVLEWMIGRAGDDGSSASLERAARFAIESAHREVVATGTTAGSTLTVVAINVAKSSITVANLGDSAALLVEAESETMLTEEHRLADSSAERERVLAAGFKLGRAIDDYGMPSGPLRAFPGGLAVCRTIGDTDCGGSVSSTPYVHSRSFDVIAGAAIIVCSDGVWDALSPEKVATYVRRSRVSRLWHSNPNLPASALCYAVPHSPLNKAQRSTPWGGRRRAQPQRRSSRRRSRRVGCAMTRAASWRGSAYPRGTRVATRALGIGWDGTLDESSRSPSALALHLRHQPPRLTPRLPAPSMAPLFTALPMISSNAWRMSSAESTPARCWPSGSAEWKRLPSGAPGCPQGAPQGAMQHRPQMTAPR